MHWRIARKGHKTYISNTPQNFDIKNIVHHLDFKVIDLDSKKPKVDLRNTNPTMKMMSLSHYVNPLVQAFQFECELSHALQLLENTSKK